MKSVADGICLLKPLDQEGIEDHLPSNTLENVNGEVNIFSLSIVTSTSAFVVSKIF